MTPAESTAGYDPICVISGSRVIQTTQEWNKRWRFGWNLLAEASRSAHSSGNCCQCCYWYCSSCVLVSRFLRSVSLLCYLHGQSWGGTEGWQSRENRLKKRARVRTYGYWPQKTARAMVSGDVRRLEDIPALRRRGNEDERVEVDRIVWTRDVKNGVIPPFESENPDAMASVKLGSKNLDAQQFGALPSHSWVIVIQIVSICCKQLQKCFPPLKLQ